MLTVKASNPRERAARRRMGMFVEEHQGQCWPGGVRRMIITLVAQAISIHGPG